MFDINNTQVTEKEAMTNSNENIDSKESEMKNETNISTGTIQTDREAYTQKIKDEIRNEVHESPDKYFNPKKQSNLEDMMDRINKNPNCVTDEIEDVSTILQDSLDEFMKITNVFSGKSVLYGITIGKACLMIKRVLKEKNAGNFTKFISNLGYSQRTVNKYMRMAEFEDVKEFAYLGVNRIDSMITIIKDSGYHGSISEFIKQYEIDYNPLMDMKDSVEEFKLNVSMGMLKYFKASDQWEVPEETLLKYVQTQSGYIKFSELRNELNASIETGSDPEAYFNHLINAGKDGKNLKTEIDKLVENIDDLKENIVKVRAKQSVRGKIGPSKLKGLMEQLSLLESDIGSNIEV